MRAFYKDYLELKLAKNLKLRFDNTGLREFGMIQCRINLYCSKGLGVNLGDPFQWNHVHCNFFPIEAVFFSQCAFGRTSH